MMILGWGRGTAFTIAHWNVSACIRLTGSSYKKRSAVISYPAHWRGTCFCLHPTFPGFISRIKASDFCLDRQEKNSWWQLLSCHPEVHGGSPLNIWQQRRLAHRSQFVQCGASNEGAQNHFDGAAATGPGSAPLHSLSLLCCHLCFLPCQYLPGVLWWEQISTFWKEYQL